MADPVHQAAPFIDLIASQTLDYALLLAAIGTLSMAFMELLKGLTSTRRHFHRWELSKWMSDPVCRRELLALAAGGEQYANVLFDQPIERMMGQIQAAASLALEYPYRYLHLYDFLTKEDIQFKSALSGGMQNDNELWARFVTQMEREGITNDEAQRLKQESDGRAAQQARVRLGNLLARRLDTFQNRTQYRWTRVNHRGRLDHLCLV
jgi:hypothetical protein